MGQLLPPPPAPENDASPRNVRPETTGVPRLRRVLRRVPHAHHQTATARRVSRPPCRVRH